MKNRPEQVFALSVGKFAQKGVESVAEWGKVS